MKRRDLERHLRDHGARLLREGGKHSYSKGATEQHFTAGFTGDPAINPPTWTADDES